MRPVKVVRIKIDMDAWKLHEKLLKFGAKVWGVVVGPDGAEIYFYEDEENETSVKSKLLKLGENIIESEVATE